MDVDRPQPWVAPEDIAAVAVARLLATDWDGRQVQAVHGPEDLSFTRVAEHLTVALSHKVTAQRVSDEDVRTELLGLGLSEAHVEAIVMMTAGIRDYFTPENPVPTPPPRGPGSADGDGPPEPETP
jgi:NAD(P)H dehydrogenase (quinone)